MSDIQVGTVLTASPQMPENYFSRSIIVIVRVDGPGVLGVVVNRASSMPASSVLPHLEGTIFSGGPMEPNRVMGLALLAEGVDDHISFSQIDGRLGTINLATPPELMEGAFEDVRVFSGYAGWVEGQLEHEITHGFWDVANNALDLYLFCRMLIQKEQP